MLNYFDVPDLSGQRKVPFLYKTIDCMLFLQLKFAQVLAIFRGNF
jgi:hypothetical protein